MPNGLLPICRWRLADISAIAHRFTVGESAYVISRSLSESLASLLHLKAWILRACTLIAALAREAGLLDSAPPRPAATHPAEALAMAGRFSRWESFTHSFSRTFYPKRFPLLTSHTILTG